MRQCTAYTYSDGEIGFAKKCPRGALPIAIGDEASLRAVIGAIARRGYEPGVLLVPGIPEATNPGAAVNALAAFHDQVAEALLRDV